MQRMCQQLGEIFCKVSAQTTLVNSHATFFKFAVPKTLTRVLQAGLVATIVPEIACCTLDYYSTWSLMASKPAWQLIAARRMLDLVVGVGFAKPERGCAILFPTGGHTALPVRPVAVPGGVGWFPRP